MFISQKKNIVKVVKLPKVIYRVNANPITMLDIRLHTNRKKNLAIHMELEKLKNIQSNMDEAMVEALQYHISSYTAKPYW